MGRINTLFHLLDYFNYFHPFSTLKLKMSHGASRYKKAHAKMRWKWKKKRTRRLQRKRRKMRQRSR
ncbi:Ribosomal protein L41 family protein [Theileria parva strain Muguga]|uniref:Ribosomal protein L41 family protein n=1 Tax=Theileria parva strain Muguga TaxID=333668 RepID=UPI001C620FE9|nr:Ribosomal protein L41 family protein [Theileria parva strain Muguga]KAF5153554.1 Ribosomal protein L41 family protein [Theileria parva strain Muguga]